LESARTPEEKAHYERMIAEARDYAREMQNYAPELPNVTFQDDLVLHDKAHDLHLAFRGRGHTAGDIVVFCPQRKVMAAGDLLHCFFPYIEDGYPREWPRTLRSAGQFEFTRAIGGHGPVQNGHDRLNQMAAYIEELTAAVEQGKRQGRPLEELERTITPATLRSLQNGGYGAFISAAEAREKGLVNRVVAADALDAEIESLAATIVAKPRVAIALGKDLFYRQLERGVEAAYEEAGRTMACNMMAPATLEGVQAFIDKRKPDWTA
jgi:glyoxylase-like metal-dependent hydrolase (beta-lactamase superfamily II)